MSLVAISINSPHTVVAIHPDAFLVNLLRASPKDVSLALEDQARELNVPVSTVIRSLRKLTPVFAGRFDEVSAQ